MKQQINEIRRMQQLAGIINESQLNEIDVTYGRKGIDNAVDTTKAMAFIRQTLKNRGYNVPEEILADMHENGATGDLFGIYDPNNPYTKENTDWPTVDYYKTFNEEKAIEMVREYIDTIIQYPEYFSDILPSPVTSLDSYKI